MPATRSTPRGRSGRSPISPSRPAATSRCSSPSRRRAAQVVHALASAIQARANRLAATVLVLEDLHWADTATLDVLRLLARRLDDLPVLVVATYRDDELDRTHPLRVALGELPRDACDADRPAALSRVAVAALVGDTDAYDCRDLHRTHVRQPVLRHRDPRRRDGTVPATVRDAVLGPGRAAGRPGPGACSTRSRSSPTAPSCGCSRPSPATTSTGSTRASPAGCSGRARRRRLPPRDRARRDRGVAAARTAASQLHARALRRWRRRRHGDPDPARLAHHAEAADDARGGARPRARRRRARRRAGVAPRGGRAVRAGAALRRRRSSRPRGPTPRAPLLRVLPHRLHRRRDRRPAARARRAAGDRRPPRQGDAHRWLSRLAWYSGDNATPSARRALAIELLEPLRARPRARDGLQQHGPAADARERPPGRDALGRPRRSRWPSELDETEILVHALNNIGSAELVRGDRGGRAKLERSLALALDAGLDEHVARAFTNLGSIAVDARDLTRADAYLAAGIAYCTERDLDAWGIYMTGYRARVELDRGRLGRRGRERRRPCSSDPGVTAADADPAARRPRPARARRGEPDPWRRSTRRTSSRRAPASSSASRRSPSRGPRRAGSRASRSAIDAETAAALAWPSPAARPWVVGELAVWRRRAGLATTSRRASRAFRLELAGDTARPRALAAIGCPLRGGARARPRRRRGPSSAARSRSCSASARARPRSGRRPDAARARRARAAGTARAPTTRANPAGLTARELEVLALRRRGPAQRRHRGPPVPLGEDRRPPRLGDPAQARRARRAARRRREAARLGLVER